MPNNELLSTRAVAGEKLLKLIKESHTIDPASFRVWAYNKLRDFHKLFWPSDYHQLEKKAFTIVQDNQAATPPKKENVNNKKRSQQLVEPWESRSKLND